MVKAEHWSHVSDWDSKYFSPEELACRGTGEICIDKEALEKLEKLRVALGKPMIINSAYRSPTHNRRVGGAKESCHMRGIAFDVSMKNHDPEVFEKKARECGFTGFGYYPASGFMHIDTGRPRVWGKKFPKRATRFEPERKPAEKVTQSGTMKGGAIGAGVDAGHIANEISEINEKAQDAQYQLSSGDFIGLIVGLLILASILYMLWRRWDAAGRPRIRDLIRGLV
jgi:zinc D-Ala-D-Ala carboxypeptidase